MSPRYEWDPAKGAANRLKHRVDFADAVAALEDELAMTLKDLGSVGEERFVTLGRGSLGQLLVVVYSFRGERIRIISARRATGRERRRYEES